MGRGPEVSTTVAAVAIALVIAVVIVFAVRFAGPKGKSEIPPEQAQKIQQNAAANQSQGRYQSAPPFALRGQAGRR